MIRDELERIRNEIRDVRAELSALSREWIADRIDDTEFDRRRAEPDRRFDELRAQRAVLHDRPAESLSGEDLDALIKDLLECRDETITRRDRLKEQPWSDREAHAQRQQRFQTLADEIDRYTLRLEALTWQGTQTDEDFEWAECKNCGHRLVRTHSADSRWLHCDLNGFPLGTWGARGCRAASLDRDGWWNDAFPRDMYAAAKPGTETHVMPRTGQGPIRRR